MKPTTRQSKEKFWREHVARLESSGLSRREYSRQHNISYWSLRDWQKKLNDTAETAFVKLPVEIENQGSTSAEYLDLRISERITIRVPENFKGNHLRRLMTELGVEL